jgi:hypothetical protein
VEPWWTPLGAAIPLPLAASSVQAHAPHGDIARVFSGCPLSRSARLDPSSQNALRPRARDSNFQRKRTIEMRLRNDLPSDLDALREGIATAFHPYLPQPKED